MIKKDCTFYKNKKGTELCKLGAELGMCEHCKAYHK